MFERAGRELGIRLADAAVVGDRASDMEAAARIGALRVHVGTHASRCPRSTTARPIWRPPRAGWRVR